MGMYCTISAWRGTDLCVPSLVGLSQLIITEIQLNGLLAGLNFEIMGDFNEIDYDKFF
jgi:hypothetical protein